MAAAAATTAMAAAAAAPTLAAAAEVAFEAEAATPTYAAIKSHCRRRHKRLLQLTQERCRLRWSQSMRVSSSACDRKEMISRQKSPARSTRWRGAGRPFGHSELSCKQRSLGSRFRSFVHSRSTRAGWRPLVRGEAHCSLQITGTSCSISRSRCKIRRGHSRLMSVEMTGACGHEIMGNGCPQRTVRLRLTQLRRHRPLSLRSRARFHGLARNQPHSLSLTPPRSLPRISARNPRQVLAHLAFGATSWEHAMGAALEVLMGRL
mmetsp:Transcript_29198/g.63969  ORF Transcript_29198/g.63969 Transcript_29198/m.63969 type:complete len:263 (+) Transcript_29198:1080-1868(+)